MNFARRPILASLIAGILGAAQIGVASAADVTVCPSGCDETSVQAGINAASAGDRVLVGTTGRTTPEVYIENIQMKEGVDVVSEGSDVATAYNDPFHLALASENVTALQRATLTVIQGTGTAPVVRYLGGITNATLDGFTIENVDSTAPDFTFLVMVAGSSPTIQNNIIRDNQGPAHNGGIQIGGISMGTAEPLIQNNIIHYVNGAGIGMTDGANPTIQDNTIFTWATVQDFAPGLGFNGAGTATILRNNLFRNGRAGIGAVNDGGLSANGSIPITIQGNKIHHHVWAGIRLQSKSGADVSNLNIIIGGPNAGDSNDIYSNMAGIRLHDGSISFINRIGSVSVQNNTLDNNGVGMWISDIASLDISDNEIKNNYNYCGIRVAEINNLNIQGNLIDQASRCGVRMFYSFGHTTNSLNISNNTINGSGFAGVIIDEYVTSGTIASNTITNSGYGGLVFSAAGTYDVLNNEIAGSKRGGIHTGPGMDPGAMAISMPTIFRGNPGDLNLTIRGNSVHNNGSGDYGGGMDVRHASGVIENNLVYKNHFGGIRFGDWINGINNNTVVGNGQTGLRGAGIVFDDLDGAINDMPNGAPSAAFPMRNNILVGNYNAGINAGTLFTSGASCSEWVGQREYNLFSENNGASTGCHGNWFPFCYFSQTALCSFNTGESNAAPEFVDAANDDYHLLATSVAVDGGDPNAPDDASLPPGEGTLATDMGAYGGQYGITTFGNQ